MTRKITFAIRALTLRIQHAFHSSCLNRGYYGLPDSEDGFAIPKKAVISNGAERRERSSNGKGIPLAHREIPHVATLIGSDSEESKGI